MESVPVICGCCGALYQRGRKHVKRIMRTRGVYICGACVTAARNIAAAKPLGSTRVNKPSGYVEEKCEAGWRRQHILVMERHIQRRLLPHEVVHHINENKTDNRLENLRLMSVGEHTREHHQGARRTEAQRRNIALGRQKAKTAKLTTDSVLQIRHWANAQTMTQLAMAQVLGVSPMTVSRVINNKTWKESWHQ